VSKGSWRLNPVGVCQPEIRVNPRTGTRTNQGFGAGQGVPGLSRLLGTTERAIRSLQPLGHRSHAYENPARDISPAPAREGRN
jgi:hypothetical protein